MQIVVRDFGFLVAYFKHDPMLDQTKSLVAK